MYTMCKRWLAKETDQKTPDMCFIEQGYSMISIVLEEKNVLRHP